MTRDQLPAAIAEYRKVIAHREELMNIVNNPVCGKPGKGFKAAKRASKEFNALQALVDTFHANVQKWITRNGKASADERTKRQETYLSIWREYA